MDEEEDQEPEADEEADEEGQELGDNAGGEEPEHDEAGQEQAGEEDQDGHQSRTDIEAREYGESSSVHVKCVFCSVKETEKRMSRKEIGAERRLLDLYCSETWDFYGT